MNWSYIFTYMTLHNQDKLTCQCFQNQSGGSDAAGKPFQAH